MLRATFAVVAIALAGSASAGGWRDLTIDGSSEAKFVQSVAALKQELSVSRAVVLDFALNEVWVQGTLGGIREGRAYTSDDYFAQLDGLGFKAIVELSDPTGAKKRTWEGVAKVEAYGRAAGRELPSPQSSAFPPGGNNGPTYDVHTQSPGGSWHSTEAVSARSCYGC